MPAFASESAFRQLDDLVLDLKGLVLVRELRRGSGAETAELEMYAAEIGRARRALSDFASEGELPGT